MPTGSVELVPLLNHRDEPLQLEDALVDLLTALLSRPARDAPRSHPPEGGDCEEVRDLIVRGVKR